MTLRIDENVSLAKHTTLQVGGPARYFVIVRTKEELTEALQFALRTAAPLFVLGGGSNVLVSDEGFPGLVIKNEIGGIAFTGSLVTAGAGIVWDELVAGTVAEDWWGLENLSAIPGSVGATPIQNVGAYGVEVESLIESVAAVHTETLEMKSFTNEECEFGYRDSFFKTEPGRKWCVTSVTYALSKEPNPQLQYKDLESLKEQANLTPIVVREEITRIRAGKFPDWSKVGTAGSFFKNPIIPNEQFKTLQNQYPELPGFPSGQQNHKVSLGWVLDRVCGLRGYCDGKVCLYEKQALVLTNTSDSAANIERFADSVAAIVKDKMDISIEREVTSIPNRLSPKHV